MKAFTCQKYKSEEADSIDRHHKQKSLYYVCGANCNLIIISNNGLSVWCFCRTASLVLEYTLQACEAVLPLD